MDHLAQHIESLIFTSESPITVDEIRNCLKDSFDTKFKKGPIEKALISLQEKYREEHFSFELNEIAGGFQFLTKTSYHNTVGTYLKQKTKKRLSKAALETLSIIAYKQPVVKSEMEKIRGVSCDYAVQKLLEKELVSIVGRGDGPGKPLQYGTSKKFMDYFGLKNIEDLPQPKDFREPDNEIGEKAPIDEDMAERDHSTSDPAALRAKVAANLSKAAAAKVSVYEALMLDVSVAVAITEIIVDGGDLASAILLPIPIEEEEEVVDKAIAPNDVQPDNGNKKTLASDDQKISENESLMLDVSVATAITEIIVDGGDLASAILLPIPIEEEVVDKAIAPNDIQPDNGNKKTLASDDQKISENESLMLDVSVATAVTEIIVDGGDLASAILIPTIEEGAIDKIITSDDIQPNNAAEEAIESEEIVSNSKADQNNTPEDTTNNFIPTAPIVSSANIPEIKTNEELLTDNIDEYVVQEVAVAVGIIEEFLSKENSDDTNPNDSSTPDIDLKKKA